MGRHSAPDDDEEPEGAVAVETAAAAADRAEELAAERRGRHSQSADAETTGPVPGVALRREADRAAAQDERPTQRIDLAAIEAAVGPPVQSPPVEPSVEPSVEPAAPVGAAKASKPPKPPKAPKSPKEPKPPKAPKAAKPPKEPKEPKPPKVAKPPKAPKEPTRGRGAQSTAADLALVRRHSDVRNRVIGAALVPFVLYAAVLLVLTAKGVQYLLWIWIPTVVAGVLVGFVLDSGHKRHPDEPEERPT